MSTDNVHPNPTKDHRNAYAHLEKHPGGFSWVILSCPFCGERHSHGGGKLTDDPRRYLGSRSPHCATIERVPGQLKMRPVPTLRQGFEEYVLVEAPTPEQVGALVVPAGKDATNKLDAWRSHCWKVGIPFIAVRLRKRHALVHTDPATRGGQMTSAAIALAIDAFRAAHASGGVGAFTYARVPLRFVNTLVPKLVAIFNAPGAMLTPDDQFRSFMQRSRTVTP